MEFDERLSPLVRGRRGAFTKREALAAGFTDRDIRNRRERLEWVGLREGVYAVRDHVERLDVDQRHILQVEALVLATPDAAISHASAAKWHGLAHLGGMADGRLQATWRSGRHRAPWVDGPVDVHCNRLPEEHVRTENGVRVTVVPRTVADVARTFPFLDAVVVGDSALARGRTTRAEIESVLVTMRGWPGVCQARRVVDCLDARAANPLESVVHALWSEAGLPRPELQGWMFDADGFIGIADGVWLDPVVIYETDGAVKYTELGRARTLLDEKLRQERIEESGAIVRRYDWSSAFGDRGRTIDRMSRALEQASRRPSPQLRLYVGDRDTPPPGRDTIRSAIGDPTRIGLTLAHDGIPGGRLRSSA